MVEINSSEFGSITIDNKTYKHDVYILSSGEIEKREHSHEITKEQIEYILKAKPEIVIIGKGTSGMASLTEDARELLEKSKVGIIEGNTPDIRNKFNKLIKTKKVAAIIHLTC